MDGRYIVAGTGSHSGALALVLKIDAKGDGCGIHSSAASAATTTASPADS